MRLSIIQLACVVRLKVIDIRVYKFNECQTHVFSAIVVSINWSERLRSFMSINSSVRSTW